jgi:ATP-dependent Clp protease adaptor protein ClpS
MSDSNTSETSQDVSGQSSDSEGAGAGVATKAGPDTRTQTRTAAKPKPRNLPPYNVVLLNDDDHSYEYVTEMLRVLFGHPQEAGYRLAQMVDKSGRAVVLTTHKEKAELKRDQIHAYGRDEHVATCCGSMSALIEPAEEG